MSARRHCARYLVAVAPWHRAWRNHFPIVGIERLVHALPAQLASIPSVRNGRAAGRSSPAALPCTKSTMRFQACIWASVYMPAQPGVMRPCGVTQVISVNTRPAPPSARAPRWTRWKSFGRPSCGAVGRHRRHHDAVRKLHITQAERQEHRRKRPVRRAAIGTRSKPALHSLEPRTVTQSQVLMADTLTACQQAVGELLRLQVGVPRDILEPFGRVACGGLQFEHFDAALGLIARERSCNVVGRLVDALGKTDGILQGELCPGSDGEMGGMSCVAHQHDVVHRPAFVGYAVEVDELRSTQMTHVGQQRCGRRAKAQKAVRRSRLDSATSIWSRPAARQVSSRVSTMNVEVSALKR